MIRFTVVASTLAAVGYGLPCRQLGESCGIQYSGCNYVDDTMKDNGPYINEKFTESAGCAEGLYCDFADGETGECEADGGNDTPDHKYPAYWHEEDCPYVLKEEITQQILKDTGCDKTLSNCRVAFQCDADNIIGVSDEFISEGGDHAAALECAAAARCIKEGSIKEGLANPFADNYGFKTINNAKMPSGCSYVPGNNRLVYNYARGNFGQSTGKGFQQICKGIEAPTHVDMWFTRHDWPITDSDYLLKTDRKCGSDPDPSVEFGQMPINAEENWKARMECQAAMEKLDRSDGICGGKACTPVKIVNWIQMPAFCIINKDNGRAFWNRNKGRNKGPVWGKWSVICRVDKGLQKVMEEDAEGVDEKITTRNAIHDFFV